MISTARVGAKSVVDKFGDPCHYSAIFDGKRLVLPSSCAVHPKYQAIRPPRSEKPDCTCAEIYSRRKTD